MRRRAMVPVRAVDGRVERVAKPRYRGGSASGFHFWRTSGETDMTELSRPVAGRRDIEIPACRSRRRETAQQIYRGQLAILRNHASGPEIQHMMEQEVEHLEAFEDLLNERRVRPSLLDRCGVQPDSRSAP